MMVTIEPKISMAGRYTIEETCKLLGMHRSTLHRYTAKGRIRCGVRRSTMRKFYLGSEILRFWKAQL
ncbi:MAG: helix-turn-helix domain-containing protein [Muribaculaceae bacterium]|nr:helix-turn-helix domain-containing protein [Muribaculaceae bacterium]